MLIDVWSCLNSFITYFLFTFFFINHTVPQTSISSPDKEHMTHAKEEYHNMVLCTRQFEKILRICRAVGVFGSPGDHRVYTLSTVLDGRELTIKIYRNRIYYPDTIISYKATNYYVHQDVVAEHLAQFYTGSLELSHRNVRFSAEKTKHGFRGYVHMPGNKIDIHCPSLFLEFSLNRPHRSNNNCTPCTISCFVPEKIESRKFSINDNQMLVLNSPYDRYASDFGFPLINKFRAGKGRRHRRKSKQTREASNIEEKLRPTPVSCSLHLVADYTFFKKVGKENVLQTANVMLSVINKLDAIYRPIDFDGDGLADNIGFLVKQVSVISSEAESSSHITIMPARTPAEYLTIFSQNNFDNFCLAIAFTFTDFHGSAGSAYPAYSPSALIGGICQKTVKRNHVNMSYNAVAVTYLLSGNRRSDLDVLLTLAHEVGHSFGAHHDKGSDCLGDSLHGRYIMDRFTVSGYKPNHYKFSTCSLRSIAPVLEAKGKCLLRTSLSYQCGNTIREEAEECDCGWASNCDNIDPCCTPADVNSSSLDKPCSIRRSEGKQCSPRHSTCCTRACQIARFEDGLLCVSLSQCYQPSYCDGSSHLCPMNSVPDGTPCNAGRQVCINGECAQNVCPFYNLTKCRCPEGYARKTCNEMVCCSVNNTCTPSVYLFDTTPYLRDITVCAADQIINSEIIPAAIISHLYQFWLQYTLAGVVAILTALSLSCSYKAEDTDHMKSFRYGKMLGVMAQADAMLTRYDEILTDIDAYFVEAIYRTETKTMPMSYIEAIARLKAFFPHASVQYIEKIVKISAREEVAVKLLLLQGFKMRTFQTDM